MLAIPAPMRATDGGKPFTSPGWIFEVKYDGYRCLTRAGSVGPTELRTKSGVDCTKWFPEVAGLLASLPGGPHVIDGEICVLDDFGRSDFERLQARARRRCWYAGCNQVTLCAFDLLYLDGRNVMALPLAKRKTMLQQLLAPLAPKLVIVSEIPAESGLIEQVMHGVKQEAFVAKRLASSYLPGMISRDWLKIKRPGWQEGRTPAVRPWAGA
jgi:bifunctional non-homologous end joining protein LigD